VTGAAGFIGSHVVEALLADPRVTLVRAVDNLSTGKIENIRAQLGRIEFIQGDLLDARVREKAVEGIETIFHEAAIPSVPRSVQDPITSHLAGDHLTLQVLESARRAGAKRLIYAGSSSAYGDTEVLPKVETMAPNRVAMRGQQAGRRILRDRVRRCYAIDTVTLRYQRVRRARMRTRRSGAVIAKFCSAYKRNGGADDSRRRRTEPRFHHIERGRRESPRGVQPGRCERRTLHIGCERHTLIRWSAANRLAGEARIPQFAAAAGDVNIRRPTLARVRCLATAEGAV
jgi:UDP-glucose 4-epimerase